MSDAETILAWVVGLVAACLVWYCVYYETVQMPETYRAWIKQTGNPSHLSYQEWKALMRIEASNWTLPPQ